MRNPVVNLTCKLVLLLCSLLYLSGILALPGKSAY